LELEVWDYWLEKDMLIGKGVVDTNQKHELIMIAIKNPMKLTVGELMIQLIIEQAPTQGSFTL
jgi:hypothetical protein